MTPILTIGVSLKLYLDLKASVDWAAQVAQLARAHPSITTSSVRLFVLPSLPSLCAVSAELDNLPVAVGAQDLFWKESGAYTGGVSGADLVALGCQFVEVGHVERRTVFGEDDLTTRRKLAAAVRSGLTPVLCVGEQAEGDPSRGVETCIAQIESALADVASETVPELVIAYEPEWAIGRAEPAGREHIHEVVGAIRDHLSHHPRLQSTTVLYGGSAKPGLLTRLDGSVDGLFLGRFAHDPRSLALILDEAFAIA
ncbi:MAG: triose-phosphate isomerase family protein [Microcella pacifica]|uniref:Triosephosphate isomerase n=1 Tax=Microcella pacifica TaxID=2591847 RepID=A0A9E5JR15_9MICO|nr:MULTISPECIES: triose-phosphate isomerase family protein [Microcella]NHF63277.1 triosephosphate isomerase [Microcella pacifica]